MSNEFKVSEEIKGPLKEGDFFRSCRRPMKNPHYVKLTTKFNVHELRIFEFAVSGRWGSFKGEDKNGRLFEGKYDFEEGKGTIKWVFAEETLDAKKIVDGPYENGLVDSLKGIKFFRHIERSPLGHPPVRFTFADHSYCDMKIQELVKVEEHKFAFAGFCGTSESIVRGVYELNPKDGSRTGFAVSCPNEETLNT